MTRVERFWHEVARWVDRHLAHRHGHRHHKHRHHPLTHVTLTLRRIPTCS